MKTRIELISENQKEEVVIKCHQITDEIQNIISSIENEKRIIGYKRETAYPLNMNDIYYFEIVDQKAFLYCENEIYESKMKLYEFEKETEGTSFFRASKSLIINADKIDAIKPSLSGRFEVVLKNKEKLIVSRQYVRVLKHMIGL
ncbi:LytTR family DNA-binding domain-containing protein [uncultured Catenibacterium sp.]|uniref:LytTR family DNA-binding domain-containing protein n=1 Tax=uncultured Catenibacterium sp. TaxID=286142 RepID=UPI0025D52ECC|nr:LytTR family DNA-binding domain-containing protein [uncultured Catenibacterium sp.]